MKMKEMSSQDMPREKLLRNGAKSLSDSELIAILLRTGVSGCNVLELSRRLLVDNCNSLVKMAGLSVEEMQMTEGIGAGKAAVLSAAFELGRRYYCEISEPDRRRKINGPGAVFDHMRDRFACLDHEQFWVVYINRANHIVGEERLSQGGSDSTVIDTKYVVRRTLEKKASAIIVLHNHPSGNPLPGRSDIEATKQLKEALKTFGLLLLDHIVVSENSYYSFSEEQVFRAVPQSALLSGGEV